ncbi:aminopeptidase N-like isoform X2 [Chelonus insularis]|uniref:aminopeptidase N-like isoform X2 n=1 Tax=Chelonus insularis TaxID=460826 RepID=UPI00158C311D|nr:aminopeptidase N-like isoform X2 [Chelonus insularis]
MRRGSVSTWEPWARRNSSTMAQFSSNRQEFMTSEPGTNGIEYQREGGFFLSHRKLAIAITVIFLLLVAVGFVGVYSGAVPRKKVYDTTALIAEDEGSEPADANKYFLSTSVFPSRYLVKLTPIVEDNEVSRVRGQVIIEFRYNGTMDLQHIVLNAKSMNITKIRLWPEDKNIGILKWRMNFDNKNLAMNVFSLENDPNNLTTLDNQFDNQSVSAILSESSKDLSDAPIPSNTSEPVIHEINITKSDVDEQHGILMINPSSPIKPGIYLIEMDFESYTDSRTFLVANFSDEDTESWLMVSRLKPINARRLFPIFDDVKLKAQFTVSFTHPKNMIVLANTPLNSTFDNLSDSWIIDTFEETPLISPHSLALALGHLISVGMTKVGKYKIPVNFWSQVGESVVPNYLLKVIGLVVDAFEELFAVAFPISKLDIICVPFADNSGNLGLISITENLFNVTESSPGITRYEALKTIIRLIGRQWLGSLVNSRNWTDVWILESSLIDLQHTLIEQIDPVFNHSTFLLDVQLDAFEADGYSVSQSLTSKVNPAYLEAFHPDKLYDRGACLLRMLHYVLKRNNSRTVYRKFVSRWSNGNADVHSFLEEMTSESNNLSHNVNLINVMESWINGHGYPVIEISRDYDAGSAKIYQKHFVFDNITNDDESSWHIPLTWINEGNDWSSPSFAWINAAKKEMILENVGDVGEKSWVIFNINSSGYYRVNYDNYNWKLIAMALELNPSIFPSSVKASLVDDVMSLSFVGSTSYATAFRIINYLKNETQPEPWTALMRHVIKLDLVLYDTPVYPDYQEFMRKLTSSLFSRVGTQVERGSRMTLIAHQLGSTFENSDYIKWAKNNYESLRTSHVWKDRYVVATYLRETLLCTFAKLEDELGWQWWQQKLGNITRRDTDRNSFLSSLACFQVPWILKAVLNEIVRGDFFDENDVLIILKAFDKHPVSAQVAFKFVQNNWANILNRFRKSYPILRAFVGSVGSGFTSEKDLADFQNFRDNNYESLKPVGYITALVEARGTSWISFLQKSLADFQDNILNLKE